VIKSMCQYRECQQDYSRIIDHNGYHNRFMLMLSLDVT
jgi:hypothetical protein